MQMALCKMIFAILSWPECVNSSKPSDAYTRQYTILTLVQLMACRLLGAKPLPEPVLTGCQLDPWEHISVKFKSK